MEDDPFVEHCLELFAPVGPVGARRLFGGHGFYAGDLMFALIAFQTLYLKVDDETRDAFVVAGGEPFVYAGRRAVRPVAMPYFTVPLDAMDDPAAMTPWAERAIAAARRANAAKPVRRPRRPRSLPRDPLKG